MAESYHGGVNSYVVKPMDFDAYLAAVGAIGKVDVAQPFQHNLARKVVVGAIREGQLDVGEAVDAARAPRHASPTRRRGTLARGIGEKTRCPQIVTGTAAKPRTRPP